MGATLDLSRASNALAGAKGLGPVAKPNLSGMTREELRQAIIAADVAPEAKARMRASQV